MRWLVGCLWALAVLVALAVGAGAIWLSRTLDSPELRARIDAQAEELLGRRVGFQHLGFRLLPPALVVSEPYVSAPDPAADPFLQAGSVTLAVELLPLLERSVVIRRLVVLDGKVRLVRTQEGIELPIPETRPRRDGAGEGFDVSVREIDLVDARLLFEDRIFDPPLAWQLDDVDVQIQARGRSLPADIEAQVESEGGTLEVSGSVLLGVRADLAMVLDRFPLTPLRQALPDSLRIDARATGTGRLQGAVAAPERLEVDLALDEVAARVGSLFVDGRVELRAGVEGDLRAPRGDFDLDATGARVRWGEVLTKSPGARQRASGTFRKESDEPLHVEGEMEVGEARYALEARFGPRVRVRLARGAFELRHWHPMLNVFADLELSGPVLAEEVEILTDPLEIRGRSRVDGVQITLPDGAKLSFSGDIVGDGGTLKTQGVVLVGEAGRVPLDFEVGSLDGDWPFRMKFAGAGLDTNAMLTHVAGRPDTMRGPLDIDADLEGRLAGETSFRQALSGRLAVRISPGALRGISILEATFRSHDDARTGGFFRRLEQPAPEKPVSSGLSRYYGDSFDLLSATLSLDGGVAHTPDFLLRTPFYSWEMRGSIRLEDLGLDARGELRLGRELLRSVMGNVGLPGMGLPGLAIPLPAIRGTLDDPRVEADWGHFWGTLVTNLPGARLLKRLGQKLPSF